MRTSLFAALILAAVLFSTSCKNQNSEYHSLEFDPKFEPYIAAYTSGIVSKNATIKVRFTKDMLDENGQPLKIPGSAFVISPKVEGEYRWADTRTLELIPKEPLMPNQVYEVKVPLQPFFKHLDGDVGTFYSGFIVQPLEVSLNFAGLMSLNANDDNYMQLSGEVYTSDAEDPAKVEKLIKISSDNAPVRWRHSNEGTLHYFIIDSISKSASPSEIKIEWNGKEIGSEAKGEKIISVPAKGNFQYLEARSDDNNQITFYFSDPVKQDQNLDGLIVTENTNFNYAIDRNTIKAFTAGNLPSIVNFTLTPAIKNINNQELQSSSKVTIETGAKLPQAKIIDMGAIVPSAPYVPLSVETINLSAIDIRVRKINENNVLQFFQFNELKGNSYLEYVGQVVLEQKIDLAINASDYKKWTRHTFDLAQLIEFEKGSIYNIEIKFRRDYFTGECKMSDELTDADFVVSKTSNDIWSYYNKGYRYDYRRRNDPCYDQYYLSRQNNFKNILTSDLGLLAKTNYSGDVFLAVTSLNKAEPIKNAGVQVYAMNQKIIAEGKSNADGIISFALNNEENSKPFMAIVTNGKEKGYLKFISSPLPLGNFDVGGEYSGKDLRGYIYGDRGVWRPGDSIYITFILEDKLRQIPIDHPILFEFYNPRGQVVQKIVKKNSLNNFYSFHIKTNLNDPTGNYLAKINAGGREFNKVIKVETIIPNRLKLEFENTSPMATSQSRSLGKLKAKWLHGAVAKNLPVEVFGQIKSNPEYFKDKHKEYSFDDPLREYNSSSDPVFTGNLNETGTADLNNIYKDLNILPGPMSIDLYAKVTEPGGNFSTDKFDVNYLPYERFVGVKAPKGEGSIGVLLTDREHKIDFVLIDRNGVLINGDMNVELYRMQWRWWWDYHEDGRSYQSRTYEKPEATAKLKTVNGKADWKIKVATENYGRYLIRACDSNGHCAGKIVYIDNSGWYNRQPEGGNNMLIVSADKPKYNTGDDIRIDFPSSGVGRALVTIEKGNKILSYRWVNTTEGKTVYSFKAIPEMAPNAYVSVSLIQPHEQTANDLSLRVFGVTPVMVEDPYTRLQPQVALPSVLRPEQNYQIKVSEKTGRAMTYTIAMVDEGILDLTKFKTPNPWDYFYSKEALSIQTYDLFDDVAKSEKFLKQLAIGGDGDVDVAPGEGTKVQRFKPMVRFLGPFNLAKGATATHTVDIPRYVGSVRTMVIAADNYSYGSVDTTTAVRAPLMVVATMPRVLGPGEDVDMPISVFAMEDNIKDVTVEVKVNDILVSQGSPNKNLSFSQTGEQNIVFPFKTKMEMGVAKVEIKATSGNETANYDMELEVRPSNPYIAKSKEELIEKDETKSIAFEAFGLKNTNKGAIEISLLPPLNLEKRLEYLIGYPHGCIEQTTSGAFPQLFLSDLMELSEKDKQNIERNIKAGIERIKLFQIGGSGGFGYWPGDNIPSEWGTNYAGHFLLEAKNKGYTIPPGLLDNWMKFQRTAASRWGNYTSQEHQDLTQAYRLYLLALAGFPENGAMNRLRNAKDLSVASRWLLAGAYYLAGQRSVAENMVNKLDTSVPEYRELGNTYGSNNRDEAIVLEMLSIMNLRNKASGLVFRLSNKMTADQWLSTQETAYILLAMAKYGKTDSKDNSMAFEYRINNGSWKKIIQTQPLFKTAIDVEKFGSGNVEIRNNGNSVIYANVVSRGIPLMGNETAEENGIYMNVKYFEMSGKEIDPSLLKQGTDFYAEIEIANSSSYYSKLDEVALSAIFPSGWQIHNPRMSGPFKIKTSKPEYMDVRDDRVYLYFDLFRYYYKNYYERNGGDEYYGDEGEEEYSGDEYGNDYGYNYFYYNSQKKVNSLIFRIALNASYTGRFYLPSVYAETMYNRGVNASVPGRWVRVVKAEGGI